MRNGLPFYKAYPRDFIEGTVGMPFEIKAAYRLLLDMIYMRAGNLPDDPRYIAGILGCSVRAWNKYRSALMEAGKIVIENGIISNSRADKELETLGKFQDKQRQNRRRPNKNSGLQSPPFDHTEPDNRYQIPEGSSDSSENFINVVPAEAGPPPSKYAFEAKTIRLNQRDLDQWRKSFPSIRLEAELLALDEWAGREKTAGKNWFSAVSGALAKKEREAFERVQLRKLELSTPKPPTRQHIDGRI